MLKTLIKKQLLEINRAFFVNGKTGVMKSKKSIVGYIVFFVAMILILSAFFFVACMALCVQFAQTDYRWIYFTVTGGAAILFGVFGSVFNTFATLYSAKDNDLLLSMPIPVKFILVSRLFGVYIMGALYSGVFFLPAMIAYYVFGSPTILGVIGSIAVFAIITVFVLILSCILGYVVAKINQKLKNKSFFTVLISIMFIAIYYVVFAMSEQIINGLVANGEAIASGIKLYAYPFYIMGKAADGDILSIVVSAAVMGAVFALVYFILNKSFLKIATSSTATAKAKSVGDKDYKVKSLKKTLLCKEFKRFTSDANYMLNCGIGLLFEVVIGVVALIFSDDLSLLMKELAESINLSVGVVVAGIVLFASNTTSITAVSVSLEGKSYWLTRSLPVPTVDILNAKVKVQDILTVSTAVVACLCVGIASKIGVTETVFATAVVVPSIMFFSRLGLLLNLKFPNLKYTNEIIVIKQSMSIFLAILISSVSDLAIVFGGIFLGFIPSWLLCVIFAVLFVALCVVTDCWIKRRGVKIYESLT